MSENDGSDIENSDIQLPETSAPFDEVACGFTDEEFRAACKVISTMNFKRELLSHKYFEPLLEQGRLLFSPLSVEEKKKRRREHREAQIHQRKKDDQQNIDSTAMKKKKDIEKKIVKNVRQNRPSKEVVQMIQSGNILAIEAPKTEKPNVGVVSENPFINKPTNPEDEIEIEDDYDFIQHHKDPEPKDSTTLQQKQKCHICKARYTTLHFFYHRLCPTCAEFNFEKRTQSENLSGKHVLVTGGRLKIGYQISLMCLRAGCAMLHITTRFPKDCAKRLAKESDWESMKSRVRIYGLDLRHIPSVIKFCDYLSTTFDRLDIIINNAAQTIRRPPNFFQQIAKEELSITWEEMGELKNVLPRDFVMEDVSNLSNMMLTQENNPKEETTISIVQDSLSSLRALKEETNVSASAILTMIPTSEDDHHHIRDPKHFPEGSDVNNEGIDLREKNTWALKLDEVSLVEFMEVQTINSTAPFIIVGKLREMMKRDSDINDKFIINVSSMEGQFYKPFKAVTHPHTNMAKASLNMMTRTSGLDYARDNIYMNSVDTGWITNENANFWEKQFTPPLDEVDGAARVLAPIWDALRTKECKHSLFYKDYKSVFW